MHPTETESYPSLQEAVAALYARISLPSSIGQHCWFVAEIKRRRCNRQFVAELAETELNRRDAVWALLAECPPPENRVFAPSDIKRPDWPQR